ncbi:MAG: hypothetical protein QNJ37_16555 [Crocosphaera sp.]|nr:hypothetical protein [Crocosphaera sp.]
MYPSPYLLGQQPDYLTGQPSYDPYGNLYGGVPAAMQYHSYQYGLYNQGNNYMWMGQNARNPEAENYLHNQGYHIAASMAGGAQPSLGNLSSDYVLNDPYNKAYLDYTMGALSPNHPLYSYAQNRYNTEQQQYYQQYNQSVDYWNQYMNNNGFSKWGYATHGYTGGVSGYNNHFTSGLDFQPSHYVAPDFHSNTSGFTGQLEQLTGIV